MKTKTQDKILEIKGMNKTYPGVRALDNVDFDLYEGEVHCLVGKNGAGKSTLIEILAGSIRSDSGKIEIFDQSYDYLTPIDSIALGIQTIHQSDQLIEEMTVAENVFVGNLKTNQAKFFSLASCMEATREIFKFIDVDIDPARLVVSLSPVEKKILCIARAFSRKVKILILDEPTASLDKEVEDKLFRIIGNIKQKGVGIIYISHNLVEIFQLGDRVTVLRDGKKISTDPIKEVTEETIISRMIAVKAKKFEKKAKNLSKDGRLKVLSYSKKGLIDNVSFEVKKGEIFGIGGLVGSGRTELVRMMFGVDKKDSGSLILGEEEITPKTPVEAIGNGIGLLTENRKKDGLMVERPIYENISLVKLVKSGEFFLRLARERNTVQDVSSKINIATPSIRQIVNNLSGGNQQKVVFAKWILANSDIIILDEPTLGIDVGAKEEIYNLMDSLSSQGKIIIMITSDNQELVSVSDRVGIMCEGSMVKILEGSDTTEENVLKYALGIKGLGDKDNE